MNITIKASDQNNAWITQDFLVQVLNLVEDLDQDGIEDHYDPDDDNDGFSDAEEMAYGSDPRNPNSVANAAPNSLELNGSSILENRPAGTIVGLHASDPDSNPALSYSLVDGNGSQDNSSFSLDENGSLVSTVVFDFETNESNYSIRVAVKDEHNSSLEKSFVISLLNIVEDFDQDGIEDHHDPDDDNDGFSDAEEIAYGSDPRNPNSVANALPQITLANQFPDQMDANGVLHIEHPENQSEIIRITAIDPDGDDLNFSIYGWQDLPNFESMQPPAIYDLRIPRILKSMPTTMRMECMESSCG